MKLISTFTLILFIIYANAQSNITWTTEVDIATSNYGNAHPRIVVDASGNPLIIWGKFSTNESFISKWNDTAFTAPLLLNPPSIPIFTASFAGPEIAAFGDTVYVVYKMIPEDSNHIYLTRSVDAGLSFSTPVQVDNFVDSISKFPVVTTDSIGNPVVAYMKFEPGAINPAYVVSRSNDWGNTFNTDQLASMYFGENVNECSPGAIICSGNIASLLYRDNFNNSRTIWCGLSKDDCASFPYYIQLDQTSWQIGNCVSSGPDGVIIGDSVYSVFMSGISGDGLCYYTSASLTTTAPSVTIPLTDTMTGLSNQDYPRIANQGYKVGIVCRQTFNGTGQFIFFYTPDITTGISNVYDTIGTGNISNGDVAFSGDSVYVVWQDDNSETVKFRKGIFPVTTSASEIGLNNPISIFPSPSTGSFSIRQNKMVSEIQSIEMFDMTGRRIPLSFSKTTTGANCSILDKASGIYLISITDSDSKTFFKKLTIE